jgi:YegS/Rv2252/BmrU family lipid kinase
MDKRVTVIVNPAAAGGSAAEIWLKKSEYLKREFSSIKEQHTKKPADAVEFARKAAAAGYDYIVSVGGDGTINEVVNGMLAADNRNKRTKLIIYPLGTGSDLSRTLELPNNIEKFIDLVRREEVKNVRVVEAVFLNQLQQREKRYFINIADCGMGAEVAKKLNESRKTLDGSLSYLLKIFQTLFNYQNKKVKVEADDNLIYQGRLNTAVIANGSYFGGGIKIAPEADIFSNKINLLLLKDFSKMSIILNLVKGYKGNHLGHPLVESHLVEKVKITASERVELELDGESVGSTNVEFKISDKKIPILV